MALKTLIAFSAKRSAIATNAGSDLTVSRTKIKKKHLLTVFSNQQYDNTLLGLHSNENLNFEISLSLKKVYLLETFDEYSKNFPLNSYSISFSPFSMKLMIPQSRRWPGLVSLLADSVNRCCLKIFMNVVDSFLNEGWQVFKKNKTTYKYVKARQNSKHFANICS